MNFQKPVYDSNGNLHPKRVKEARLAAGWSHEELADKAGIDRSLVSKIEQENAKKRQPKTVSGVCRAFGQTPGSKNPAPPKKLVSKLYGKWYGYHLTHRESWDSSDIEETHWSIHSADHCTIRYTSNDLSYTGSFTIEAEGRLVFSMQADAEVTENAIWRFHYPIASNLKKINGHAFGIDFFQNTVTGKVVLSKNQLKTRQEQIEALKKVPEHMATLPHEKSLENKNIWHDRWEYKIIENALEDAHHNDVINILGTYFPAIDWLEFRIRQYCKYTDKNKLTGVKIRMLVADPRNKKFLDLRCAGMHKKEPNMAACIYNQVEKFRQIGEKFDSVEIEIKAFNTWLSSMSIQVSNRVLCFSLLLGHESAENSAMAEYRDPATTTAGKLHIGEFNTIWEHDETTTITPELLEKFKVLATENNPDRQA